MKLGVALPLIDVAVGGDPAAIREFAQTAEEIGYQDLAAPDHVLGVNVATRPDWGDRNTSADLFHDPFVLFGFLANCTRNVEFSTQVLILAQRQAVLVAKQAASLDVLCGGRFRLGVGVGWNPVEFTGLNENFRNRGRRSEEQVEVMQALWAEPHVTFAGKYHTIEDAGINPLPLHRKVPIWFGGHAEVTMQRVVKWGDGWMPLNYAPGDEAVAAFDKLRAMAEAAGRDPASIGIDTRTTVGIGAEAEWRETARFWKSAGVTHLTPGDLFGARASAPHRRSDARRPSRRDQALLERGRRSAVSARGPGRVADILAPASARGLQLVATRPSPGARSRPVRRMTGASAASGRRERDYAITRKR
jgi:probable F420-dependent oxidoreductase